MYTTNIYLEEESHVLKCAHSVKTKQISELFSCSFHIHLGLKPDYTNHSNFPTWTQSI